MSLPVRDAFNFSRPGAWGPTTSTLDFCEANYQFSHYVAEMANTVSNVVTVGLGLHGANRIWTQGLPSRYLFGFLSLAIVGLGSMAFHATLLHTAQLSDELPMIYAASCSVFILFDARRTVPKFSIRGNLRAQLLILAVVLFDVLFTYAYWVYRNPIFHQVVFAGVMATTIIRGGWLLKFSDASKDINMTKKQTIGSLYKWGAGTFISGFLIWNLDNIFCDVLSEWKLLVNWPSAFLLEGHSWWHILTGTGSYLMWIGTVYLTLCIGDDPEKYAVAYDLEYLPHVHRIPKTLRTKQ